MTGVQTCALPIFVLLTAILERVLLMDMSIADEISTVSFLIPLVPPVELPVSGLVGGFVGGLAFSIFSCGLLLERFGGFVGGLLADIFLIITVFVSRLGGGTGGYLWLPLCAITYDVTVKQIIKKILIINKSFILFNFILFPPTFLFCNLSILIIFKSI